MNTSSSYTDNLLSQQSLDFIKKSMTDDSSTGVGRKYLDSQKEYLDHPIWRMKMESFVWEVRTKVAYNLLSYQQGFFAICLQQSSIMLKVNPTKEEIKELDEINMEIENFLNDPLYKLYIQKEYFNF